MIFIGTRFRKLTEFRQNEYRGAGDSIERMHNARLGKGCHVLLKSLSTRRDIPNIHNLSLRVTRVT